jgi:F0F1-type ATP synthase epsilon subunit
VTALVPKFAIGDKVWAAGTTTKGARHPCPDCLGSRKWDCKTPAGVELTIDCPRCTQTNIDGELRLDYTQHVPYLRELTIGSVRTDTADREHPISYMCVETGIGWSGIIWYETRLHADKDSALRASELDAALSQREHDETPHAIQQAHYAGRTYLHAIAEATRNAALARIGGAP